MKVTLILLLTICISSFGFSLNTTRNSESMNSLALSINQGTEYRYLEMPPESCLQIAAAGMNQAFANYDNSISLCANIHTTGQGFLDCARFARRVREVQIAMIYLQLENCDDTIPGTTI
jgi:hypothetical protein